MCIRASGASASWLVVLLALALGVLTPAAARAQACCTATGSSYLMTARPQHAGLLSLETSYERGFGSFDARGRYRALSNASVNDVVVALAGALRLGKSDWQVATKVPLRLQHRKLRGLEQELAFAPGDVRFDLRWSVVTDEAAPLSRDIKTWVPTLTPFAGVLVPSGNSPEATTTSSGVDITGDGSWTLFAGVQLSKTLGLADNLDVEGSYGYRLARSGVAGAGAAGRSFAPGDEIQLQLGWTHQFDLNWTAGLSTSARFTLAVKQADAWVEASDTRRVRGGVFVARYLALPTWQLRLTLVIDPPVDALSKNVPFAGSTVTLSLLRLFMR